ncbi:MAG: enoyl-CoA hydratase-related protein [Rhodobacteraceae bacterium]|nr:enoyl-CoA hydratase-related protein [Paracoccaceae bacterium]
MRPEWRDKWWDAEMVIEVDTDARGVMTLWLNRPDVHNAMSAEMMDAISDTIAPLTPGGHVRVVVLAGRGESFCAGGDLGWMRAQFSAPPEARLSEARRLSNMLGVLHGCDLPVIGRLHGNAFGGGVGLACVCDSAFGAEGVLLGLTETRLGLIPATIGPYVAARLGPRLRSVFMSSRVFGAQEGAGLGLLAEVVASDALEARVEKEVRAYLGCAPGAVADAKRLARMLAPGPDADTIEKALRALVARWESEEAVEGVGAFFEKRPPAWKL